MKFKVITFLSLAFLITLIACEDQETTSTSFSSQPSLGEIEVGNTTSSMQQGILQYSAKAEHPAAPYYRHELGLLASGFTTHYDASQGLMVQGEGTSIWISLNAPATELTSGAYTFSDSQKEAGAYDFWYGTVNTAGKRYRFSSGVVTIQQTHGGLQMITVSGLVSAVNDNSDQKEIHATFTGTLTRFKSL